MTNKEGLKSILANVISVYVKCNIEEEGTFPVLLDVKEAMDESRDSLIEAYRDKLLDQGKLQLGLTL